MIKKTYTTVLNKIRRTFLEARYGFIIPAYDGMMNEAKCRFLWDMVVNYKGRKGIILEIGSWQGCSTSWLATAGKRHDFKQLIAIDLFTGTPSWDIKVNTYDVFSQRMQLNKLDSFVKPIVGDSKDVIKSLKLDDVLSILHIDGDHEYSAVKADINNYAPLLDKGGVLIIDDYDSVHPDVVRATTELLDSGTFELIRKVEEIPDQGYGTIALRKI